MKFPAVKARTHGLISFAWLKSIPTAMPKYDDRFEARWKNSALYMLKPEASKIA
jgi:hypothetical protein